MNTLHINAISAVIFIIICIPFSSAYFSYALGIFLLFLIYEIYKMHKEQGILLPQTTNNGRKLLIGTGVFYLVLIGDNLLLLDWESVKVGMDIALLSLPFYMFFFLGSKFQIDLGVKYGIIISGVIIAAYGLYSGGYGIDVRYRSFFAHPNHFGTVIDMLCPFLCIWFCKNKSQWEKVALGLLIGVLLFCLYKTGSRGAIAALGGGILLSLLSVFWIQRKKLSFQAKRKIGIFCVAVCLIGGAAFGYLQAERSGTAKIGGERILMLEASYDMWEDHKWLGIGLSRWEEFYYSPEYHPVEGHEQGLSMPHNIPVYFFTGAGIGGGIGYLMFLLLSACVIYKTANSFNDIWFSAAILTAFWAFTIQGLVDTTIINKIPARIYFALIGYYVTKEISR